MVKSDIDKLRRLAKQYRIGFRDPSREWPEAHAATFENIKKIGSYKYDSYCQAVSVRSDDEPWTKQTKARAEWLAKRATRLFGQDRNEAGWRFGLENDVLRRFSIEVGCPVCRARVWKSEIEATLNESDDYAQRLEERRDRRKPCRCPPALRFDDLYEIGANNVFDDRAEEFVVYDECLNSQLPKKRPDRIFGLQNTNAFQRVLSRPASADLANKPGDTVADIITASPFKSSADPLLFPFLLLEAKSETSSNGFDENQLQSAFPILALLKMQENLESYNKEGRGSLEPLVWYFAYRGDAWRVYGCYLTKEANGGPTKYEITLLWNGTLLMNDDALQLVLIVDYIMDWAREIYRGKILQQLRSMVTKECSDQVTLTDSDIFSIRKDINSWIPAPPSTTFGDDLDHRDRISRSPSIATSLDHQALLQFPIPNTKLGSVRSAGLTDFHFVCLYLTEKLVRSIMQLVGGRYENRGQREKAARQIVNLIASFDEVLVLTGVQLDMVELAWTGTSRSREMSGLQDAEEFYVIMEASWYMSSTWDITRELSCVAISKPAFELLVTYAGFQVRHSGIETLPRCERTCPTNVLQECLQCLRSSSPWQALLSAISCTLVSIYPLPERKRADFTPPTESLGFGHLNSARVNRLIYPLLKLDNWKPKGRIAVSRRELERAHKHGYTTKRYSKKKRGIDPVSADLSFKRISKQRSNISLEAAHDHVNCVRCLQSHEQGLSALGHGFLDTRNDPILSEHNAVLIVSLKDATNRQKPHSADLCLFALDRMEKLSDNRTLALLVEDLMKCNLVYHTIQHELLNLPWRPAIEWNVPLPFRSLSHEEHLYLRNWLCELRSESEIPNPSHIDQNMPNEWQYAQMLMYCLSIGHCESSARTVIRRWLDGFSPGHDRSSAELCQLQWSVEKKNGINVKPVPPPSRIKSKLKGENTARRYNSWVDGLNYLEQEYPKHYLRYKSVIGR